MVYLLIKKPISLWFGRNLANLTDETARMFCLRAQLSEVLTASPAHLLGEQLSKKATRKQYDEKFRRIGDFMAILQTI